jgi:thiamine-phosphate pyrophosphorylase
VIVNDRADIALMARAAGVHVGQEDLPVEDARRVLGPMAIVGVSTHDRSQVDAALRSSASYLAVGPVFETPTKDTGYAAVGPELVAYAASGGRPVVAIGGMTPDRAVIARRAGAASVAVIGNLLAGDPEVRLRAFLDALAPSL